MKNQGNPGDVEAQLTLKTLVRKDDYAIYGNSGYLGVENQEVVRNAPHLSQVECRINKSPTSVKEKGDGINRERGMGQRKSSVRARRSTSSSSPRGISDTARCRTEALHRTCTASTSCLPAPTP